MVLLPNIKEKPHFRNVSQDCFSTRSERICNRRWTGTSSPPQVKHPGSNSFASRKNYNLPGKRLIKIPPGYFAANNSALRLEFSFKHFSLIYWKLHPWLNLSLPNSKSLWVMLYFWDADLKQEFSAVLPVVAKKFMLFLCPHKAKHIATQLCDQNTLKWLIFFFKWEAIEDIQKATSSSNIPCRKSVGKLFTQTTCAKSSQFTVMISHFFKESGFDDLSVLTSQSVFQGVKKLLLRKIKILTPQLLFLISFDTELGDSFYKF